MLLNFKCNNFKSFKDGFDFQMKPENRMTELYYSILTEKIMKKDIHALSASVVYGSNASGKTSVINAMSCFKQIIIKGNIEDSENDRTSDHISANMNLIPFSFLETMVPISFDISFTHHKVIYRYTLSFVVGKF